MCGRGRFMPRRLGKRGKGRRGGGRAKWGNLTRLEGEGGDTDNQEKKKILDGVLV